MGRLTTLGKTTAILFLAKGATQLVSLILLPLYTAVLSTVEYGEIDLYTSLSMLIIPFMTLQIEQSAFRYLVGNKDEELTCNTISSSIIVTVMMSLVALAVFVAISFAVSVENIAWLSAFYLSQAASTLLLQIARGMGKNGVYGFGSFLLTLLSLSFNVILVAVYRFGVNGAIASTTLANIIVTSFLAVRLHIPQFFCINTITMHHLRKMLGYSVPLIFNQVSSWLINYSSRIILLVNLGMGANGIYAAASKFSNALSTVFGTFNLAWTENVVLSSGDDDYTSYLSKMMTAVLKVYLGLTGILITLMGLLFPLLINLRYADAYYHIPLLLGGMFFSGAAAVIGSIYIAFEKTGSIAVTTCISGVTCLAINALTVKLLGLYSSSISNIIAFGALFSYRYIKMHTFCKSKIKWVSLVPFAVFLLVICAAYYLRIDSALFICLLVVVILFLRGLIQSGLIQKFRGGWYGRSNGKQ